MVIWVIVCVRVCVCVQTHVCSWTPVSYSFQGTELKLIYKLKWAENGEEILQQSADRCSIHAGDPCALSLLLLALVNRTHLAKLLESLSLVISQQPEVQWGKSLAIKTRRKALLEI